jgi:pimeloyl-ACP methyl ester carboxylesterase
LSLSSSAARSSAGLYIDESPSEQLQQSDSHRIVFVHGAMDRVSSFSRARLRLRKHTTLAYDRRGYAKSVEMGRAESFEDHVGDLLTVINGQRSVVVGHSYGATVAVAAAARNPELVSGSSTLAVGDAHGPEAAAEAFMRRIVGDATWEGLSERTKAARRAEGQALLFDLAGLRGRGCPYDIDAVVCPTVVGHGELSLPHHIESSVVLHRQLSCRRVLRSIAGARHGAHSSHPDAFAELVTEAISMISPDG